MGRSNLRTPALLTAVLMLACTGRRTESAVGTGPRDPLRVQLQWYHGAQFAGLYVALAAGIFADSGLEVQLLQGGPNIDPTRPVLAGDAEIGIHAGDQLLLKESSDSSLRVLGVVFNRSVAALAFRDTSGGVDTSSWLDGKQAYVYDNFDTGHLLGLVEARFKASSHHVNAGALDIADAFKRERADIWGVYVFNEPIRLRQAGIPYRLIRPEDVGIPYYSDTYFSTAATQATKREILRRFLSAAAEGWRLAALNPDAAVDSMLALNKGALPRSNRAVYLEQLRELVAPRGGVLPYLSVTRSGAAMFESDTNVWLSMCSALVMLDRISTQASCNTIVGTMVRGAQSP